MRRLLFAGLIAVAVFGLPIGALASQSIDSPHQTLDFDTNLINPADTEECGLCHFSSGSYGTNCEACHKNKTGSGFTDTSAPWVKTHQGFNCHVCHNPHVSKQYGTATPLVAGSISSYSADSSNRMTFTVNATAGSWKDSPEMWAAKTSDGIHSGADRGLLLWFTEETTSYSFEVTNATATTITVKGAKPSAATWSFPENFELHYGQLISTKISTADIASSTSYREGTRDVDFTTPFGFTNPSGSDGVCQVCHTQTHYWKNDGSLNTHNVGLRCTKCHEHTVGFMLTACTACHPGVAPHGYPEVLPDHMASPPTGSQTAGAHQIHAGQYGFECSYCHQATGMVLGDENIGKDDGIQIGFSFPALNYAGHTTSYNGQATVAAGAGYDGTNSTTITATGAVGNNDLKCSNTYCHSSGQSVRMQCGSAITNESQNWDVENFVDPQADNVTCNNCHGYDTNYIKPMVTGSHYAHIQGISCKVCHSGTTEDGITIRDTGVSTYHVNGSYDVMTDGNDYDAANNLIEFDYVKSVMKCMPKPGDADNQFAPGCHSTRTWKVRNDPGECPDVCATNPSACENQLPYVNFSTRNMGDNHIIFTDLSYDLDASNSAKNAFWGGAHDGSPGLARFNWNNTVVEYQLLNMTDNPAGTGQEFGHYYPEDKIKVIHGGESWFDPNIHSVGDRAAWLEYRVADNACNNAANNMWWGKCFDILGDGVAGDSGFGTVPADKSFASVATGWILHLYTPADPTENIPPIVPLTHATRMAGHTPHTVILEDIVVDPDYNDPVKAAHYGGGHDGSAGRIKINWNNAHVTEADLLMTDTGHDAMYFEHTYPLGSYNTTKDPNNIWYWITYDVNDNNPNTTLVSSGWFKHVEPK